MADRSAGPLDAPNVTYLWAQLLVEELVRTGVSTFFVAPGSRSTPLTVAAARHPTAEVILHVDERGTAFAALGWGRATGTPAAWITTSGTAVANGRPAVVEAAVDAVPMILLTADRPPELQKTSANQTIDQVKFFGDDVRQFVDVPPPTDDVDPAYVLTTVDQAVHRARRVPPGPVHLNCRFRKPLEPVEQEATLPLPDAVQRWAQADGPYTHYPTPTAQPAPAEVEAIAEAIADTARGLVVAGRLDSAAEADAAQRLAVALGWPLVPDLTSRLRLGGEGDAARIPYADLVLTSDAFRKAHVPDAVVQVGGRFVSKRLRHFLRDSAPPVWGVVRPDPTRIDPDHRVTHHVEAHLPGFAEALRPHMPAAPGTEAWRAAWTDANRQAAAAVRAHAEEEEGEITEPAIATQLSRLVPSTHAIVAASSMPVRDLNRHADASDGAETVYANRGASGIDGTVATAAGAALGRDGPVTLLIGDLALWHDLNSLALLQDRPVVVVVVNNDGGGIFHFLPIRAHDDVFEPYFTTPQGRSFEGVAETFNLTYAHPASMEAFQSAYRQACNTSGPALIEVDTDRSTNRRIHDQLEAAVERAVAG